MMDFVSVAGVADDSGPTKNSSIKACDRAPVQL